MDVRPTYAPLVSACRLHGIGRSTAFNLARDGHLKTYKVGARTFVDLESLRTLPERLAAGDTQTKHNKRGRDEKRQAQQRRAAPGSA